MKDVPWLSILKPPYFWDGTSNTSKIARARSFRPAAEMILVREGSDLSWSEAGGLWGLWCTKGRIPSTYPLVNVYKKKIWNITTFVWGTSTINGQCFSWQTVSLPEGNQWEFQDLQIELLTVQYLWPENLGGISPIFFGPKEMVVVPPINRLLKWPCPNCMISSPRPWFMAGVWYERWAWGYFLIAQLTRITWLYM